ncbi:putative Adenosylhomocysteinase [Vibrio nigripulchritudo MADA3029]|nr:putative Adenosylhomocysteinase [Vibrio nigripulchritudo MADA3020]CCN56722.1 putative Adenosylhomocysteinase [Vibrio nigripulchritudo MADA3021]CCN62579.1 putative Adenosylhomocysteinase [Vibrio nigripulchritudo MADA3029]
MEVNMSNDGRVEFVRSSAKILRALKREFERDQPFQGLSIGVCLHIEPKTALLCEVLQAGGAFVAVTGNIGTTDDATVDYLNTRGITCLGYRTFDRSEHHKNLRAILDTQPHLLLDNGADLYELLYSAPVPDHFIGGTEETTTGAHKLRERLSVHHPIFVINDSLIKLTLENQYGVGQSVLEAYMDTTNLMINGKDVLLVGYGWCGKGIAKYFSLMGAKVTVAETSSIAALAAFMEGYTLSKVSDAIITSDVVVTATGRPKALSCEDMKLAKTGCVFMNAGHLREELPIDDYVGQALLVETLTPGIQKIHLDAEHFHYLLGRGEMVNLTLGKGDPIETVEAGLALQALTLRHLAVSSDLSSGVFEVPQTLELALADTLLEAQGITWR